MSDARAFQEAPQCLGPEYGAGKVIAMCIFPYVRSARFNPLATFDNVYEYQLARFFNGSKTWMQQIDEFVKCKLLPKDLPLTSRVHFKSGYTTRNKMRQLMDQPLELQGVVDFDLQQWYIFYYRDVVSTIAYLLQQRTFPKHLVWEPVRECDGQGNCVFTEIYTGDWCCQMQA